MPEKEAKLSGMVHLPDVSSRENLITYKRRRVSNKCPKPEESSETLMKWKIKKKGRDMGWTHGKMINGNRQHWQCNWCGLTRYGGGVTRLKRHLAGDLDVRQCPNAPAAVVKEVRRNLIMSDTKMKKKNKKNKEMVVMGSTCQENPERGKTGKEKIEAENTKSYEAKDDLCNKEKLWESWRGVLENMLNMPNGSGSDGVHICIRDVLSHFKGSTPCNKVGTSILTKWGRVLADILSNDKFRLLCTLLCTNFGDGKFTSACYFDFSQIDTNMKEGEYEHSPDMFHKDIQKVWEKFERIGREMVDLATSLSSISKAAIEKQIGSTELNNSRKDSKVDSAMPERKNSVKSNTSIKSTSFDSNPTLDNDELEPSQSDMCNYKSSMCSYCNLPIGEWEHISCTGCDLMYHLACVNPFTDDDTSNHTWYCSVCVSDKPIKFGTGRDNLVPDIDARNSAVQLVRTGPLKVCKICRGPEERGETFLTCGRLTCPYKYYHIKCLKKHQIANAAQANKQCWYCPSCVCHTCFANEDGHLIISCAGCDKAYCTYCMNLPHDSVPNEKWYCHDCHREREVMTEYERENVPNSEAYEPMRMLICALESMEGQEQVV